MKSKTTGQPRPESQIKQPQHRSTDNRSWKRFILLILSTFIAQASALQATLRSVQMNVGRSTVSQLIDVQLELFRSTTSSSAPWQPQQCFELNVKSPYKNPSEYQTFSSATPPVCSTTSGGFSISCQLKPTDESSTLQFVFPQLEPQAVNQQSITFAFTNFNTPFSAQVLSQIQVFSYSDEECSLDKSSVRVQSLTTQPAFLPSDQIQISSSSNVIGNVDPQNTLSVTFTPQTTMAPGGAGKIEIGIPFWYEVGSASALMYNPESLHECNSTCMTITSSILQVEYLNILYENMLPECISGKQITINCSSFYNPIWQDKWYGFYVNVYDNEKPLYKPIEKSDFTPFLDSTQYLPAQIPIEDFLVEPSDTTVNTFSEWTMYLEISTPMMQECYILVYVPLDFKFDIQSIEASGMFLPKNLQVILSTNDITQFPPTAEEPRESIMFHGCNQDESLGFQASGRIFIRSMGTQVSIKDSATFNLEIYKDEQKTQLIAKMDEGKILSADGLEPGRLTDMKVYPLITTVQLSTLLYINFTSTHDIYPNSKIIINLPNGLVLPTVGTQIELFGLPTASSGTSTSTQATSATVLQNNSFEVLDFVQFSNRVAPYQFWFALQGIENQLSAKEAGSFKVTTYYKAPDNSYYIVDTQSSTESFIATPGLIDAAGDIKIDNPTNNADNVTYSFNFAAPGKIPEKGFIQIDFPIDLVFIKSETLVQGSCFYLKCEWVSSTSLRLQTNITTAKNQQITLNIGGIKNPRTFLPTGSFVITSFDTDGVSLIDSGFRKNVKMSISGTITEFEFTRQSEMNGAKNDFTFSIKTDIPISQNDVLLFTFPPQLTLNAQGSTTVCISTDTILCSISGNGVQISLILLTDQYSLTWTMTNIGNPASLASSDTFTSIQIQSDLSYLVAQYNKMTAQVINTQPAPLQQFKLFQESLVHTDQTSYKIEFTPVNPLPPSGSIKLVYPQQITPSQGDQTKCFVTTNQVLADLCTINTNTRTIRITNAFAQSSEGFYSQITISLVNMTNPSDNRLASGFELTTYSDADQKYISDTVSDVMVPVLQCDYPCSTCPQDNRQNCTSCWSQTLDLPRYLMSLAQGNGIGRCEMTCDNDYTSNGAVDKKCQQCDQSCDGCNDNGLIDDSLQCTNCSLQSPFRMNNTQLCLSQCVQGLFTMADNNSMTCGVCDKPCSTCFGQRTSCTSCDQNSSLPLLYKSECVASCPIGATDVAGVCEDCKSPCKTCSGSSTICTSCDSTEGRDLIFSQICYNVCPPGYVTNFTSKQCLGCLPGCDLCSLQNTTNCEQCGDKLGLYLGGCRGNCPDGMKIKNGKCQSPSEDDLILMYFPFLFASLMFMIIVFFGKLKKKAILIDGKKQLVSTQKSITTINAFVAPLQTLATILQCVLAFYYGYYIHFALALVVYLVMFGFNIMYLNWFLKNFYSKHSPQVGEIVSLKDKGTVLISAENQWYYENTDHDPEFRVWVDKHRTTTFLIFSLMGGCHFKVSKMFYSHYLMFDMFKARWTRAVYLRTTMEKWQLAYLVAVDFSIIGVSLYGLFTIPWTNQLFICMLESILIALVVIVLGLVEKRKIKEIFNYTETANTFKSAAEMLKYKKRKLQLGLATKTGNSKAFKDRKLDDLLEMFGARRCKSVGELHRENQEIEQDDRELYTWPISPQEAEIINSINLKFTSADAYDMWDNVYTEGVTKPTRRDMNIQSEDPQKKFFQDALNRKQDLMLSESQFDQDLEELQKLRTQRKRGRKNKYYNQIDQEDGDEIGEASQEETYQRLLQQQEDEEEALKDIITEETLKAREIEISRKLRKQQEKQNVKELELLKIKQLKEAENAESLRLFQESEFKRLEIEEQARQFKQSEIDKIESEKATQEMLIINQQLLKRRTQQALENEENLENQRQTAHFEKQIKLQDNEQEIQQIQEIQKQEIDLRVQQQSEQIKGQKIQKQQEIQKQLEAAGEEEESNNTTDDEIQNLVKQDRANQLKINQNELGQIELEQQEISNNLNHQQEQNDDDIILSEKQRQEQQNSRKDDPEQFQDKIQIKSKEYDATKLFESNIAAGEQQQQYQSDSRTKQQEQPLPLLQQQIGSPKSPHLPPPKQMLYSTMDDDQDYELPSIAKSNLKPNQKPIEEPIYQTIQVAANKELQQQKMNKTRSITLSDDYQNDPLNSTQIAMNQDIMKNFKDNLIQVPPQANMRLFNEHDVLGDVDRDEKANVVVHEDQNGCNFDKQRNPTNQRGYLIDPASGDVIDNIQGDLMFPQEDLDDKGELPAPFSIEKYNFNPHWLMGHFDYNKRVPTILRNNQGVFVDKNGRRVNEKGWYVLPGQSHLVDKDQRKKFDKKQLVAPKCDDLPKLFNYSGKRFDIRDVMGEFEKDQKGHIILQQTQDGEIVDNYGRLCNERGYLTDDEGNIIDKNGRQLWKVTELKNGEFIKIFPFSKFNLSKVQGEVRISPQGNPILEKQHNGEYLDRMGRPVNARAYLIDKYFNVIDVNGKLMFERAVLEKDGEIPAVFRSGLLRQDTASSISRLMSEIERNNMNESYFNATLNQQDSAYDENIQKRDQDSDTSVDSKMEDTPANYNLANQRFDHNPSNFQPVQHLPTMTRPAGFDLQSNLSENPAAVVVQPRKKKDKKKAPKLATTEFLEPTEKDKNLAKAFGGEVKPEIRRPRVKYDSNRVVSKGNQFRITTADEPRVRAQLDKLGHSSSNNEPKFEPKKQGLMGDSVTSNNPMKKQPLMTFQEPDYEKVYGKDIDQFLDDSEWDIDNFQLEKVSQSSDDIQEKVKTDLKLAAMEKKYLNSNTTITPRQHEPVSDRLHKSTSKISVQKKITKKSPKYPSPLTQSQQRRSFGQISPRKVGPPRELINNVTSDPQVIHRGEILEFETKKR